ncbi:MAG: transcriptional repressor [Deltaproteobacteria bacterium]|nr:transcriptional repressor [Deltaproteobacteria bacterium]
MEKRRRNTKQQQVIWEAVKEETSHPTADQIFFRVRRELPNISLGTVYRNLQKLVGDGRLQVLTLGRAQHFDPLVAEHQHFICEHCDQVYDVLIDSRKKRLLRRLPDDAFTVTSHKLAFFGCCNRCVR